MAITTTDVVTNVVAGNENIRNGVFVTTCFATGEYHTIDTGTDSNFVEFDSSLTYNELESLLTTRYDDISYYNAVDGGTP
jgi:hypothetical protein